MVQYSTDPAADRKEIPGLARLLGYAGVLPFLLTAVLIWFAGDAGVAAAAHRMLMAYGAVILSFLGGVRWGLCIGPLTGPDRNRELGLSVLPPLVAWVAFLPGPILALGILVTGFIVQCLWDVMSAEQGRLPRWYATLRLQLTAVAVVCLLAGIARLIAG